jgi:hypothetical protein
MRVSVYVATLFMAFFIEMRVDGHQDYYELPALSIT